MGIESDNLLAAGSDAGLALQLMIGRVEYALKAKNHMRETMPEFRADWALLQGARLRVRGEAPGGEDVAQAGGQP